MAKLTSALSDDVKIVEKVREEFETRFDLLRLVWRDDAYAVASRESATKAPCPEVIWFEPAIRPVTAHDGFLLPPRFYQRARGQLVCRARDYDVVPMLLTMFRHNPAAVSIPMKSRCKPPLSRGFTSASPLTRKRMIAFWLRLVSTCAPICSVPNLQGTRPSIAYGTTRARERALFAKYGPKIWRRSVRLSARSSRAITC